MGCLTSKKPNNGDSVNVNQYSWSNRTRSDISTYIIQDVSDNCHYRLAGQINGEQFIIQNCNRATICLFDYSATVMIDDCKDCTFFIGPVIGSIAVRNCEDCKLMCASQQFRTRDCKRLDLYLCCPTHPAIESCCSLRFSCFSANYPQLKEQFEKANLNTLNNNWSHVYDFSLDEQQKHWTVVPPSVKPIDLFKNILQQDIPLKISFNPEESLVPLTQSITSLDPFKHVNDCDWNENKISEESKSYLIFIYSTNIDSLEHDTVKFIRDVQIHFNDITLMLTKYLIGEKCVDLWSKLDNNKQIVSKENPNRLVVVMFRSHHSNPDLSTFCNKTITKSDLFELKIFTDDNDNFFNALSLAFDNVFNCSDG